VNQYRLRLSVLIAATALCACDGSAPRSDGEQSPGFPEVAVVLADDRIELSGALHRGRQTLEIRNADVQLHQVVLARLGSGRTPLEFARTLSRGSAGASAQRSIEGLLTLDPGDHGTLTLVLEPGPYALFCALPDTVDGRTHAEHGMVRELVVR